MKERLRASDYRFILICAALLAATTWFSVRNFYRAFPEASIDFKVSRGDARDIAARFLSDQGYRLEGYRHAAQFTFDEQAKTFLEREVGLERANRIMGTRVRLWRWANRWFRPLQKEEYNVEITPLGQLAGFAHRTARRRRPPRRHHRAGTRPGRRFPAHPPRPRPSPWISSRPPTPRAPIASTAPSPGKSAISSWTTPPTVSKSPSSAMRSAAIASTSRSPNSGSAITSACAPKTKSPPPSIPP